MIVHARREPILLEHALKHLGTFMHKFSLSWHAPLHRGCDTKEEENVSSYELEHPS